MFTILSIHLSSQQRRKMMPMKVAFQRDPLFEEVKKYVQQQKVASCSMIQRRFRLGFNRAGQILEQLEEAGVISIMKNGQRKVL